VHDDQARLARVLCLVSYMLRCKAEFAGAIAASQEALALATARGDLVLQADASFFLAVAYWSIGDYGQAAALFRRNVEALEPGMVSSHRQITSREWLTFSLSQLGQFAEGRRQGEEALRCATAEGRGNHPLVATCFLGRLYLAQGDLEAAIRMLERSLALCRAADNWHTGRSAAASLGYAYALAGRLAEGDALLEETIRESRRSDALQALSLFVAWLSAVCLLDGRVDEAMQHARQALALARQYGERGFEAEALYRLGAVHARTDPPEVVQSEARYRQALALAEELGMRPLQAHCHLGLGTLYAESGQRAQACTALSTAIALYQAMDMTFWLTQAEAALGQLAA
jgi:tetratricopeptide (TPR) repeat protein